MITVHSSVRATSSLYLRPISGGYIIQFCSRFFITFCLSLPNIEVRPSVEEVQKMLCQVNLFKSGSILAILTLFKRGNICKKSKLHRSAKPSSPCARGLLSGRVWVSRPSSRCSRRWSRSWPGRWGGVLSLARFFAS